MLRSATRLLFAMAVAGAIPATAIAKLAVVTTTTDLAALVREVGGEDVSVESIAKGTQDPHFVEAKPSYMVKVSRADLIVAIGLELEVGWLPSILQGARNPKVKPGASGYLEVGSMVDRLEVRHDKVSRAEGDVHPEGNPHFLLDPIRAGTVALRIADALGELDPKHAQDYLGRAKTLERRLQEKTRAWAARLSKLPKPKVVSYHKTLSYFFDRFKIANPAILEPKPGIPPTTRHILSVIETIKTQKVALVLVENYYDPSPVRRIEQEVPGLRTAVIPVAVEGEAGLETLDALYERLISAVEGSSK